MPADGRPKRFVPTVPPAQRDELSSSWLGRLLGAYRLYLQDVNRFLRSRPDVGRLDLLTLRALDATPPNRVLRAASALTAASPDEIRAMSLAARYPHCSPDWFSTDPNQRRSPAPIGIDPAIDCGVVAPCCPDCLRDDRGLSRVAHIRAGWVLSAETICPLHRCSLRRQCLNCGWLYTDYDFPHAVGVWRPCCDGCGLPCDAIAGDAVPTCSANAVEFLLSFESSLGAALRGRSIDRRWSGSRRGPALLGLVGDLSRALVQTASNSGKLAIEHFQVPQFPFLRSRSEEESGGADMQLPYLPVESRRAVFAVIAVMLRPDLACQVWPDPHAFQGDPLRGLLECLRLEDRSALLAHARAWPHALRARIAAKRTTPLPGQRKATGNGRPATGERSHKQQRQGQLMV